MACPTSSTNRTSKNVSRVERGAGGSGGSSAGGSSRSIGCGRARRTTTKRPLSSSSIRRRARSVFGEQPRARGSAELAKARRFRTEQRSVCELGEAYHLGIVLDAIAQERGRLARELAPFRRQRRALPADA
jgi:hypothetical protein